MAVKLYFDGASRGNPGEAGAGVVIKINSKDYEYYKYLGRQTNNYAEYQSLLLGLENLIKLENFNELSQNEKELYVYGDSQLIIRQLTGKYQVKSDNLQQIYRATLNKISELRSKGWKIKFTHVPRNQNKHADRLANKAIDFK